jgi:hypothetical protein
MYGWIFFVYNTLKKSVLTNFNINYEKNRSSGLEVRFFS